MTFFAILCVLYAIIDDKIQTRKAGRRFTQITRELDESSQRLKEHWKWEAEMEKKYNSNMH